MLKSEVFPKYRLYAEEMEKIYAYLKSLFDVEKSTLELCKLRGYLPNSDQHILLKELKICSCGDLVPDNLGAYAEVLGLSTKTERFLLDDRFIIPVRDIMGNLITLIGYYPDKKKYITQPSPFFSKDIMFFNIDHAFDLSWKKYNGVVFLIEGIFDCLSLRAIDLPALATMGSTVSTMKGELLKLFRKVIYIPDNDAVGLRALNRHDKLRGWAVPPNAVGVKLKGVLDLNTCSVGDDNYSIDNIVKIKDIDNLVSWFDRDSVRESLLQFIDCTDEVVILEV